MSEKNNYQVFISYRRKGGDVYGKLIYEILSHYGYKVFFDNDELIPGEKYRKKILNIIKDCEDVIVILSSGCLERCFEKKDVFKMEIGKAFEYKKNVIPLFLESFEIPAENCRDKYPKEIKNILNCHGYIFNIYSIDSLILKIKNNLRSKPDIINYLEEKSNKDLIENLLINKDAVNSLSASTKEKLVRNIFSSSLGETKSNILLNEIASHQKGDFSLRNKFVYEIELSESDFRFPIKQEGKYWTMKENLYYIKKYANKSLGKTFWISFLTDTDVLDESLKKDDYFFSESLNINNNDLIKLAALQDNEKKAFYNNFMKVKIVINKSPVKIKQIIINEIGIFAEYEFTEEINLDDYVDVRIQFSMPYRRTESYFFVSLSDYTYCPYVRFVYDETEMEVKTIPFLNRTLNTEDSNIFDGMIEINIEDKWISPMSGVVFLISRKQQNED